MRSCDAQLHHISMRARTSSLCRPALEHVLLSQAADAMRHPLARSAATAAARVAAASAAPRLKVTDAFVDMVKPLYESVELLLEKLEAPACVVHAQVEGLPPRWRTLAAPLRDAARAIAPRAHAPTR
jgi:hypothetical protein